MGKLQFRPIDLASHLDLCLQFRRDAFAISFGSADGFFGDDPEKAAIYAESLGNRMARYPGSCVHVWQGETIIGQMEMGPYKLDPAMGHVYLYYLVPAWRGKGVSGELDAYAVAFLAAQGYTQFQLCVSPTNRQAVRYYEKHGWQDAGPREDSKDVRFMRKTLAT